MKFVLHFLLLAGLVLVCGRFESMPQVAAGGDVLSVAFGDAREVISRAAVEKANSYFHGGVEIDCHDMHGAHHDHEHGHDEHCLCCHHEHEADADDGHDEDVAADEDETFDPWYWINSRIRAPQVDRHIEDDKAVELMPWFWAAVRADPHNADAWCTAWYVARYAMKDRALAKRVVAEAKAKNPESIEIAFTEGRDLYDNGQGDLAAAKEAFVRARFLGDAKCGGDGTKLSEHEEEAYRFSANYLKSITDKLKSE